MSSLEAYLNHFCVPYQWIPEEETRTSVSTYLPSSGTSRKQWNYPSFSPNQTNTKPSAIAQRPSTRFTRFAILLWMYQRSFTSISTCGAQNCTQVTEVRPHQWWTQCTNHLYAVFESQLVILHFVHPRMPFAPAVVKLQLAAKYDTAPLSTPFLVPWGGRIRK